MYAPALTLSCAHWARLFWSMDLRLDASVPVSMSCVSAVCRFASTERGKGSPMADRVMKRKRHRARLNSLGSAGT